MRESKVAGHGWTLEISGLRACLGLFFGMVDDKVSFATAGFMCRLG